MTVIHPTPQSGDRKYRLPGVRGPAPGGGGLPAPTVSQNPSLGTPNTLPPAGYSGRMGGVRGPMNQQEALANLVQGMQFRGAGGAVSSGGGSSPGSGYWQPGALSNAPVPYPSPGAMFGNYGGGGGSGMSGSFTYVPKEEALGPGAYMPGNAAQWRKDISDSFNSMAGARQHGNKPAERYWELEEAKKRASGSAGAAQIIANINAQQAALTGGGGGAAGSWQGAMNSANQANEARYQDILGGWQGRYERGMDLAKQAMAAEAADINQRYDAKLAQINQDLVSRGMTGSSNKAALALGVERERNAELGRLRDRQTAQQLAVDTGLSGDTLQFMERKNESGPDMAMLAQLAARAGAGGAGMGGGGGGGGGGFGYAPAGSLGFQNPMLWAAQAMQGGQGSVPMMGGGGGFESSQERYERQTGRPWYSRIEDQLVYGTG